MLRFLTDPALADFGRPALFAGVGIAALCGLLSVLVVLKRMAFIGQGVSHSALGGLGVAAAAGVLGASTGLDLVWQFAIVGGFCLASGLLMGVLTRRDEGAEADTAIGVVLVGSMSIGSLLLKAFSRGSVEWESFLFGAILGVSWAEAWMAWALAAVTLGVLWYFRRPLVFWAFDGATARAMGVREGAMNLLLLTLLTLATVAVMRLAGVVLATAMLVLPGAAALRVSRRSGTVMTLAAVFSLAGAVGGLLVAFERDWLPGASIVCVLCAIYAACWAIGARR
ncbi:MAG TPA: metal ABC transporter permease [Phycisphaerales bacterium]|nr:metal ABC transporter permease [Phycisphaerales bacterium]